MESHQDIMFRLKEFKKTLKLESEIWNFVDCLMKDLEICKKHNRNLEKQLEDMVIQGEQSIPKLYVEIKEQNNSLNKKNSELEETLKNMEINLKEMKQEYDDREKHFFDQLQNVQVTFATDFDKIEQKLRCQLSEANKKNEESNIIIKKLQTQLRNMKENQVCTIPEIYVEIREQNNYLSKKNIELEEKLKNLERTMKGVNQEYDQREKKIFDEFQNAQVTFATDIDEVEQELNCQRSEANNKNQESNIIIKKLQTQLRNMEENQKYTSNTMFFPPANDTIFKENKARKYQPEECPINESETSEMLENIIDYSTKLPEIIPTNNKLLRTYESLQVKCSIPSGEKKRTLGNPGIQPTPLFKGTNYLPKRWTRKPKNPTMIPPLMPCSSSKQVTNKKRKLHDPDDLSYLVQLMGNDENNE